jgi:protoheme IX farnesyltransferase
MKNRVRIFYDLIKLRVSLLVTLSTATGFVLAADGFSGTVFFPAAAVFLLTCGSSSLNQFQERRIDALMKRTKNRPLPSGRLKPLTALSLSFFLLISGFLLLFFLMSPVCLILGLFSVLWYNIVYTSLKRVTAFAAIPGAVIGAVPPAIGWVAGGGSLLDPGILAVALFFFIWQIPHFWLLLLSFADDYKKAGLPALTDIFTGEQLRRITLIWILATVVTGLCIPLFGIVHSAWFNLFVLMSIVWLVWNAGLIRQRFDFYPASAFRAVNLYAVLIMLLLSFSKIFSLSFLL